MLYPYSHGNPTLTPLINQERLVFTALRRTTAEFELT